MNGLTLPIQHRTEVVRLTLADHYLQGVAKRDQPALAAESAHLADMAHIDQSIAVNSLKVICWQPYFDAA